MGINIRPETVQDYPAIAAINARAFGFAPSEALIVALARHHPAFDPELSLVAELDGRVIGHVLFTRQVIRLLNADVPAVLLAPIAVDPAYHGQGFGGALIVEGHNIARAKGYTLSFLLGHATYYPRFGYRTGVYGASSVTVTAGEAVESLETRPPTEADVPALQALWLHEEGGVDFSVRPGDDFLSWSYTNPALRPLVYLRGSEVIGYTRSHQMEPLKPRLFLARDVEAARSMVSHIGGAAGREITLPLHPYSASAAAFEVKPTATAWDAGMGHRLAEGPFDDFCVMLEFKTRLPGRPLWPPMFEIE